MIFPEPLPPGKAHSMVAKALRKGQMIKPAMCERCPATDKIQGRHPDYRRPLFCVWLCPACHAREHMRIRASRGEALARERARDDAAALEEALYAGFTPEQVAWLKENDRRNALCLGEWWAREKRGEATRGEVAAIEDMLWTPQKFSHDLMKQAAVGCFPGFV